MLKVMREYLEYSLAVAMILHHLHRPLEETVVTWHTDSLVFQSTNAELVRILAAW